MRYSRYLFLVDLRLENPTSVRYKGPKRKRKKDGLAGCGWRPFMAPVILASRSFPWARSFCLRASARCRAADGCEAGSSGVVGTDIFGGSIGLGGGDVEMGQGRLSRVSRGWTGFRRCFTCLALEHHSIDRALALDSRNGTPRGRTSGRLFHL